MGARCHRNREQRQQTLDLQRAVKKDKANVRAVVKEMKAEMQKKKLERSSSARVNNETYTSGSDAGALAARAREMGMESRAQRAKQAEAKKTFTQSTHGMLTRQQSAPLSIQAPSAAASLAKRQQEEANRAAKSAWSAVAATPPLLKPSHASMPPLSALFLPTESAAPKSTPKGSPRGTPPKFSPHRTPSGSRPPTKSKGGGFKAKKVNSGTYTSGSDAGALAARARELGLEVRAKRQQEEAKVSRRNLGSATPSLRQMTVSVADKFANMFTPPTKEINGPSPVSRASSEPCHSPPTPPAESVDAVRLAQASASLANLFAPLDAEKAPFPITSGVFSPPAAAVAPGPPQSTTAVTFASIFTPPSPPPEETSQSTAAATLASMFTPLSPPPEETSQSKAAATFASMFTPPSPPPEEPPPSKAAATLTSMFTPPLEAKRVEPLDREDGAPAAASAPSKEPAAPHRADGNTSAAAWVAPPSAGTVVHADAKAPPLPTDPPMPSPAPRPPAGTGIVDTPVVPTADVVPPLVPASALRTDALPEPLVMEGSSGIMTAITAAAASAPAPTLAIINEDEVLAADAGDPLNLRRPVLHADSLDDDLSPDGAVVEDIKAVVAGEGPPQLAAAAPVAEKAPVTLPFSFEGTTPSIGADLGKAIREAARESSDVPPRVTDSAVVALSACDVSSDAPSLSSSSSSSSSLSGALTPSRTAVGSFTPQPPVTPEATRTLARYSAQPLPALPAGVSDTALASRSAALAAETRRARDAVERANLFGCLEARRLEQWTEALTEQGFDSLDRLGLATADDVHELLLVFGQGGMTRGEMRAMQCVIAELQAAVAGPSRPALTTFLPPQAQHAPCYPSAAAPFSRAHPASPHAASPVQSPAHGVLNGVSVGEGSSLDASPHATQHAAAALACQGPQAGASAATSGLFRAPGRLAPSKSCGTHHGKPGSTHGMSLSVRASRRELTPPPNTHDLIHSPSLRRGSSSEDEGSVAGSVAGSMAGSSLLRLASSSSSSSSSAAGGGAAGEAMMKAHVTNNGLHSTARELLWSELELGPVVGEGSFGKVRKGSWRGMAVAVKTLKHQGAKKKAGPHADGASEEDADEAATEAAQWAAAAAELRHEADILARVSGCNGDGGYLWRGITKTFPYILWCADLMDWRVRPLSGFSVPFSSAGVPPRVRG